jgi:hypothetical protein
MGVLHLNKIIIRLPCLVWVFDIVRDPTHISILGGHEPSPLGNTIKARVYFSGVVFRYVVWYLVTKVVVEPALSKLEISICVALFLPVEIIPLLCR